MKIYTIKFLLAAVFGIGLLPAHAQTFSDVQPSDQRDVDWADERNYQDDFAPYSESEYLPQEQIDDEAPIEYDDAYYDDVDLIEEDIDYNYYGEEFDYYDTGSEDPYLDTSL
ncbi:MAG: hypothetical protein CMJ16_04915 [Peredibacter sp.]|nr:hypothetical protein [Peredibacter sp.]